MKKTVYAIILAFILWGVMFSPLTAPHLNFWAAMSVSAVILICLSFILRKDWKGAFRLTTGGIVLGIFAAIALWFVFDIGNYLSNLLFDFARPQVASIYGLRSGTENTLIAAALLFLIGPAEVIFWQGLVQTNLMQRLGDWRGFLLTTLIYTLVHLGSLNFMLIMSALVCGICWGMMYLWVKPRNLVPLLFFHALWDVSVFVLFPIL